jgi:hypothetical protein
VQTLIVDLNNEKLAKQLEEETGEDWTADKIFRVLTLIGPEKLHELAKEAILEYICEGEF